MENRFGKKYKLCSDKNIQSVFDAKTSVKSYPLFLHYGELETKTPVSFQITISAPKRNFKKAHERNRIKRLLREAIRQNKLILETFLQDNNKKIALFLIYTGKEEMPYTVIEKKIQQLFLQLMQEIKHKISATTTN